MEVFDIYCTVFRRLRIESTRIGMVSNTAAAALLSPAGSGRYTSYTNSISIFLRFYAIIYLLHRPPDRTESFLLDTLRVSITSEAGE